MECQGAGTDDERVGRPLQHREEEVLDLGGQVFLVPVRDGGVEDDDGGVDREVNGCF